MTETTRPRANRDGHPCPPWCTTDHETPWSEDGYTFTFHGSDYARVELGDRSALKDEIGVQAVHYGDSDLNPVVGLYGDRRGAPAGGSPHLRLEVDDAGHLADLIEMLAKATPTQRRELAAAIRQAAAQVTEARDG